MSGSTVELEQSVKEWTHVPSFPRLTKTRESVPNIRRSFYMPFGDMCALHQLQAGNIGDIILTRNKILGSTGHDFVNIIDLP